MILVIWIVYGSLSRSDFRHAQKQRRIGSPNLPPAALFRKIPKVFSSSSLCLNALICIVTAQALRSHTMANPYTYADQRQWSEIRHRRRGDRRDGEFCFK